MTLCSLPSDSMHRFELRINPVVENMLSTGTDDEDMDRKMDAT